MSSFVVLFGLEGYNSLLGEAPLGDGLKLRKFIWVFIIFKISSASLTSVLVSLAGMFRRVFVVCLLGISIERIEIMRLLEVVSSLSIEDYFLLIGGSFTTYPDSSFPNDDPFFDSYGPMIMLACSFRCSESLPLSYDSNDF